MRHGFVKTAAASIELRVADVEYNAGQILAAMERAESGGVRVLCLPELCLTGASCGDLFLSDTLLGACDAALERIARASGRCLTVFGLPLAAGGAVYNCAAAVSEGKLLGLVPKQFLSASERRWFAPGTDGTDCGGNAPFGSDIIFSSRELKGLNVAVAVGEDVLSPLSQCARFALGGAVMLLNPHASPAVPFGEKKRLEAMCAESERLKCVYVCAGTGKGESATDLVYRGDGCIIELGRVLERDAWAESEPDIRIAEHMRRLSGCFAVSEDLRVISWGSPSDSLPETELSRKIPASPYVPENRPLDEYCEDVLDIQCRGLAGRMEHIHAKGLVLGISGGLDSTLAMIVCARTLDRLNMPRSALTAVTMPCFGTTGRTKSNAEKLSLLMGASFRTVPIADSVMSHFRDIGHDFNVHNSVFENAQARERTQVLMDIANADGSIVVGTGDLSELALGWATYNGDHMSMFGVNAGIPKTVVQALVRHYSTTCGDERISEILDSILATPISPELLPLKDGEMTQITEDLV
ncbi:MAG: NAD(+) synthase, partial [Oscillospiraceae bacterium]|nr:NAD(+) synthase [Oscillospiraceae bacterium]